MRQEALEWWFNMQELEKEKAIALWKQEYLGAKDFRQDWNFSMITHSSSTIKSIYTYLKNH